MRCLSVMFVSLAVAACGDATAQSSPPTRAPATAPAVAEPTPAAKPVVEAAARPAPSTALDPDGGKDIGLVFEAYLSPHQEGDEEDATPKTTPAQFRSTTPSQSRAEREAAGHRAHGQLRFSKDFSRAFVEVKLAGVKLDEINMFHIHCGKPGILGPILLDFSVVTDLKTELADGTLSLELRNEHIVKTSGHDHGLLAAFTAGCFIPSPSLGSIKPSKVSTIAGMAQLALDRELYFNLHTTGQTYYGDMRGQIHPVDSQR